MDLLKKIEGKKDKIKKRKVKTTLEFQIFPKQFVPLLSIQQPN